MGNILEVIVMVLRGLSISIIDLFFAMTVLMTFMTVYRFKQFSAVAPSVKAARELVIELVVQGILIGALFSLFMVVVGLPVLYTEYLYFLLPMSFIIGFYHIRYTNLIYSSIGLAAISFALNGQTISDTRMPNVEVSIAGLVLMTGVLMLLIGLLILVTGTRHMKPVVVHTQGHRKLGFGMQRFWPIPVTILAAMTLVAEGETVSMPDWWPLLKLSLEGDGTMVLFVVPLLFVMSHGSISFSHSPERHVKWQGYIHIISGLILTLAGYTISGTAYEWTGLIPLFIVAIGLELIWNQMENEKTCRYDLKEEGVYVVGVKSGTLAHTLGFRIGQKITQVNDEPITGLKELTILYKGVDDHRRIILDKAESGNKVIDVQQLDILEPGFGLTLLEEHPAKIFDYEAATNMNMMHLMHLTTQRKRSE